MSDADPWAQQSGPTVHVIRSHRATVPPPGVYSPPPRNQGLVALVVVLGSVGLVVVLGIVSAIAIPLFLSQREKATDARDEAGRSQSQVTDGVVDGYGYNYALAPGWVDADGAIPGMPSANVVDTATMIEDAGGGVDSLLLVEVEDTRGAPIDQVEAVWRRNASVGLPTGVRLVDGPSTSVAGNEASVVLADGLVNEFGGPVDFRALLTVRDDHLYALTFMFRTGDSAGHEAMIDDTLASWQWE
jgi:hypothetical protein